MPRRRTALRVLGYVGAWLAVAVPAWAVVFTHSTVDVVLASHDATLRPNLAGEVRLDMGPYLPDLRTAWEARAYTLLGDDLVLRVNKAGVQVFGVVLENAGKAMTAHELLELKAESSDLVVPVGTRGQAARDVGYRLGRVAGKLLRATRERMGKS